MTDKDILISDLNDISEILNNNGYGGWCATIRKAVDLLKEQEAIPIKVDEYGNKRCGSCGHKLHWADPDSYCCKCGKAVKWE